MAIAQNEILFSFLQNLSDPLLVVSPKREVLVANTAAHNVLRALVNCEIDLSGGASLAEWRLEDGGVASALLVPRGGERRLSFNVCTLSTELTLLRVLQVQSESGIERFHAQRLQTLGALSSGVAHDFNNVLTGILGHVTYLKTILPATGSHVDSLTAIEHGARKASSMTKQILNFSKLNTTGEFVRVDLCELVCQTCSLLRGAISPKYKLDEVVPPDPVYVMSVEGQLAQVIVNLVVNARDAISDRGTIQVIIEEDPDIDSLAESAPEMFQADQRYVALKVVDDGCGISPQVMERIFEPYFSTKAEKGTGLGLPTVKAIVNYCKGILRIDSVPGEGTQVVVYLPATAERASGHAAADDIRQRRKELEQGAECILVVDDEEPVRNVLKLSLERLGYSVILAGSGQEALDIFKGKHKEIDLVILDMLMPQLSGQDVFHSMRKIDPGVRVLISSGYSSEEAIADILDHGGKGYIQKPFTIEELATKVRTCFEPKE